MNGADKRQSPPPPVISAPPERELERKLKRNPNDPDAKADVGSDESMDASDPSSAAQPGSAMNRRRHLAFPENAEVTDASQKRRGVARIQQSTVLRLLGQFLA